MDRLGLAWRWMAVVGYGLPGLSAAGRILVFPFCAGAWCWISAARTKVVEV